MDAESKAKSGIRPPHPAFALSLGVTGHRPNRLPHDKAQLDRLRADVEQVLDEFAKAAKRAHHDHAPLFPSEGESLTLVSALAEGADTIVAKAALSRHFKLDAPLPFARKEYENDFIFETNHADDPETQFTTQRKSSDAIREFEELLAQARSVLELPGSRGAAEQTRAERQLEESRAYEAAGLTILSQADVLLAIWDGKPSQGRGGTPELIAEAARIGIPIVIVDAHAIRPPEVRWRNFRALPGSIVKVEDLPREDLNAGLHRVVDELVRAPGAAEQESSRQRWFDENEDRINVRIEYPVLMSVLFARCFQFRDLLPAGIKVSEGNYRKAAEELIREAARSTDVETTTRTPEMQRAIGTLATPYAWADTVAVQTAQLFRSAVVFNFVAAALAVIVASFGVVLLVESGHAPEWHTWWEALRANRLVVFELVLIAFVVTNTVYGHRAEWHRRWYETRELAERLRVALPLWAVGLRPGSFPGEETTWTGWYARAFVRMQGMRAGTIASEHLRAARSVLLNVLREQCHYNELNARRARRANLVLEIVGLAMLLAIIVFGIDHIVLHSKVLQSAMGGKGPVHETAIWLSVALPALASATYGIRVIGDFEGIHRRAERTQALLDQFITAIEEDPDDLTLLRARAGAAADAMLGDVSSWRLSAESRGLAIPG